MVDARLLTMAACWIPPSALQILHTHYAHHNKIWCRLTLHPGGICPLGTILIAIRTHGIGYRWRRDDGSLLLQRRRASPPILSFMHEYRFQGHRILPEQQYSAVKPFNFSCMGMRDQTPIEKYTIILEDRDATTPCDWSRLHGNRIRYPFLLHKGKNCWWWWWRQRFWWSRYCQ